MKHILIFSFWQKFGTNTTVNGRASTSLQIIYTMSAKIGYIVRLKRDRCFKKAVCGGTSRSVTSCTTGGPTKGSVLTKKKKQSADRLSSTQAVCLLVSWCLLAGRFLVCLGYFRRDFVSGCILSFWRKEGWGASSFNKLRA